MSNSLKYNELAECVKQYYSEKEYLWLSDAEKAQLETKETLPEDVDYVD